MSVRVVSLILMGTQEIPNDGEYHLVKFPFVGESYDPWGMHNENQPDGALTDFPEERSGLIWPSKDGWGQVDAMVYWESGDYSEVRDRFVRDPLSIGSGYDSTATEDHAPTPGGQYRHKAHSLFVHPDVSLGFLVKHNASQPVNITHAQFKLTIHDVEAPV